MFAETILCFSKQKILWGNLFLQGGESRRLEKSCTKYPNVVKMPNIMQTQTGLNQAVLSIS